MLDYHCLHPIKNWGVGGSLGYCIGADIGASGMRIRVSNPKDITEYVDIPHSKAKCAKDIYNSLDILAKFIQKASPQSKCFGSAFAIPGIRTGTDVCPHNWPEPNSARTIRTSLFPESLYPRDHHNLLNDLEAGAYGLVQMQKEQKIKKYFRKLWGPEGTVVSENRTAVMAIGTGLGAAIIVRDTISKLPVVVSTEFGYLQTPGIMKHFEDYKGETELQQFVSDHYYKGEEMPCFEDFASARGICVTRKLFAKDDDFAASKIAYLARRGDEPSFKTLKSHYMYFTRLAKNIAAAMQCETVVMALSNQVANDWLIRKITDDIKKEFFDYTRPDWLKNIRVFSQHVDLNFNLIGASYMAHQSMK